MTLNKNKRLLPFNRIILPYCSKPPCRYCVDRFHAMMIRLSFLQLLVLLHLLKKSSLQTIISFISLNHHRTFSSQLQDCLVQWISRATKRLSRKTSCLTMKMIILRSFQDQLNRINLFVTNENTHPLPKSNFRHLFI